MKRISPAAELWKAPEQPQEQLEMVARAARLCYASEKGKRSTEDFCQALIERGHLSMFRHASHYFVIDVPNENSKVPVWLPKVLIDSAFVECVYYKVKHKGRIYFASTNGQVLMENERMAALLAPYEVTVSEFVTKANELHFSTALMCIRYTVCVTTQISTSRELNRTSPNNIAEQSTRYVNFGRRGGITICTPHWFTCAHWTKKLLARIAWKLAEWEYCIALHLGLPPQDAREFLPLSTATRVVYTYSVFEWRHIFALRLTGTTGKPHPNAQIAAQHIHDAILPLHRIHAGHNASLIS